jgi:RNA polymerase sigma-70 factor (ECF subfamily)
VNQPTSNNRPSTLGSTFQSNFDLTTQREKRNQQPVAVSRTPNNALNQASQYHPAKNSRHNPRQTDTRVQRFRDFVDSYDPSEITSLLIDWGNGNQAALDVLFPLVERELRRLAHSYMRREKPDHILQTTALVNEAYLRLTDQKRTQWQNRAHFFGIAAQVMRRILLNHARDMHRQKRGGNAERVQLSEVSIVAATKSQELIALDEALALLASFDERKSKVVELRFFGGLDVQETAEVLGVSAITVNRDWQYARAWLVRQIQNAS